MSDQSNRRTYDTAVVAQTLGQLHEYVTRYNARIEITHPGSAERCVLVSKEELDALERAIEILSDTEDVRYVSERLAHLASIMMAGDYASV